MPQKQRIFFCIDMKSFYASVECAERQLNPFETCLVVADETRGEHALCLAISPKMKALGVKNRCRLSDIPRNVKYIIAPPRMQLYIDYAADIYAIYLNYFAPEDIHVYSIDESFLDVTGYLGTFHMTPKQLAKTLMNEIADKRAKRSWREHILRKRKHRYHDARRRSADHHPRSDGRAGITHH